MGLLRFMLQSAGRVALLIGLVGLAAGAANGALIAVVHRAISDIDAIDNRLTLTFVGLAAARILLNFTTGSLLVNYGQESITRLRNQVVRGVLGVDFRSFERIGKARVLTTLTQDAATIGGALQVMPTLVVNAAMTAGGACYLLYLSPTLFVAFAAAAIVGAFAGTAVRRSGGQLMREARRHYDELFAHLRTLTDGIKELKMHSLRREEFLDGAVVQSAEDLMGDRIRAQTRFLELNGLNSTLHLLVIGGVLFWLPVEMSAELVSGYILTILYILGPSAGLIRAAGTLTAASIALQRIEEVGVALSDGAQEQATRGPGPEGFERVSLEAVTFDYHDGDGFHLGPVDLTLEPGELTLISGPNGSGKSTLARIVAGLYAPGSGAVHWDGEPVDDARRDAYRQLFSVVFYDFHLFEQLWGLGGADVDRRASRWLDELGLRDVVSIDAGRLTTTEVSSGQRRRLALLSALLEDRPVLVLDEVAADQDVEFSAYLHDDLIPRMLGRGKSVVLISHDPSLHDSSSHQVRLTRRSSIPAGGSARSATQGDEQ